MYTPPPRSKATRRPSGDHVGCESAPVASVRMAVAVAVA
jgi:hypothetical protein